jgi:hypothetical protein
MISSGDDRKRHRDIAVEMAARVSHLFTHQLDEPVTIRQWDYRLDNPTVVRAGTLPTRSLSMVDRSECLLAILGKSVPPITSQEILRAFERRRAGSSVEFWMFLDPRKKTRGHEDFLQRIKTDFGEEVVYAEYQSDLQFQATVTMTLVEYVFKQLKRGTVIGGGSPR